jgi:hypothetical protein
MIMYVSHLHNYGKYKTGRTQSRLAWAKKQDSLSKITRAEKAGGMAQMIGISA